MSVSHILGGSMTELVRGNRLAELREILAYPLRSTLVACAGLVSIAGCHSTHRGYEALSTAGFRYSAGAAVVGSQRDTLRVAVVVVNESNQQRVVALSHCRLQGDPVKALVAEGGRSWNSEIDEVKPLPVLHDSMGQPMMEACTADLLVMTFPPGARSMSVLKVPIRQILGDSLPSGRYRVTARLTSNGGDGRKLDAGEVVLR
jgi:hypothetical protein